VPRPWYFPVTDLVDFGRWLFCGLCGRDDSAAQSSTVYDQSLGRNRRRNHSAVPARNFANRVLSLFGFSKSVVDGAALMDDSSLADEAASSERRFFEPLDSSLQVRAMSFTRPLSLFPPFHTVSLIVLPGQAS
jgi:hypothetical protein